MNHLFSDLMKDFDGYAIGKMLAYLKDPEIISFAGGLPSDEIFPTEIILQTALKSIRDDGRRVLQYSSIPGEKDLMSAVIDYLKLDGINISLDNILITTSGQHGLDLVGRLFLNPRDIIVADLPTFGGALAAFMMEDADYLAFLIEDNGSDVQGMEDGVKGLLAANARPKFIYVVPDFQNPSGITMSLEKRLALLELSREYEVPLVEDSPYRELRYKGESIPSLFELDENRGNVIGLYTFSKILCPGIRVGFNIGPPEVMKKMSFIKGANILNTPKLNQDICRSFLTDYDLDKHFLKARTYYAEKLDFILKAMSDNFDQDSGVTWTRPEGGLFLWITVPKHINTLELFYDAIEEKVAFVPGEVFYPKGQERHNTLRINFSYPTKEQIVLGIERLAKVIKNYNDRPR